MSEQAKTHYCPISGRADCDDPDCLKTKGCNRYPRRWEPQSVARPLTAPPEAGDE